MFTSALLSSFSFPDKKKSLCNFLGGEVGIGGQYHWATIDEGTSKNQRLSKELGVKLKSKESKADLEAKAKTKGPEAGMESRNPELEAEALVDQKWSI